MPSRLKENHVKKFVTEMAKQLLASDSNRKQLMKVSGYLNYYLGFACKVSPIINTFLKMTPSKIDKLADKIVNL